MDTVARPQSISIGHCERFLKISTRVHLGIINTIKILSKVQKNSLIWPIIGLTINLISLCVAELYYWKFPHLLFKTEDQVEVENDDPLDSIPMETIASPVTKV